MIDPVEGHTEAEREGLAIGVADHECADQPGALGHSDSIQILRVNASSRESLMGERPNGFDMGSRRHLGNDTTESLVQFHLRTQHRTADVHSLEHGDAGLVTTRFDAQDERPSHAASSNVCLIPSSRVEYSSVSMSVAHMTSASSVL